METPKNVRQTRSTRNPTPRLSERKKNLFTDNALQDSVDSAEFLEGIELLDATRDGNDSGDDSASTVKGSIAALLGGRRQNHAISFFGGETEKKNGAEAQKPQTVRSLRVILPRKSTEAQNTRLKTQNETVNKENAAAETTGEEGTEEQLQKLFCSSMQLSVHGLSPDASGVGIGTDGRNNLNERRESHKRHTEQISGTSPQRKVAKVSTSPDALSISTKIFYSAPKKLSFGTLDVNKESKAAASSTSSTLSTTSPRTRARQERRSGSTTSINRGVRHKIRRRPRSLGLGASACHLPSLDVDLILNNLRNDKLKKLIASKREERLQIEKVHNIFRNSRNPIAMARPLSIISNLDDSNNNDSKSKTMNDYGLVANEQSLQSKDTEEEEDVDFSDIECNSVGNIDEGSRVGSPTEEVIPIINHQWSEIEAVVESNEQDHHRTPLTKRKFFKSGRTSHTPKQVKITENIKASVCNGRISLVQEERKIRKKPRFKQPAAIEFSDEQATVEAILKNLDDTAFGDIVEATACGFPSERCVYGKEATVQVVGSAEEENGSLGKIQLQGDIDYAEFRKRLPYNTSDPEVMEQQHLLLDFLISNHICTEENFKIFIADPDNHKEEAARIVDQVIVVVNEQTAFRQRLPYKTTDPEIAAQQHERLDFLIENDICTEENFRIFVTNYEQRRSEAEAIVSAIERERRTTASIESIEDIDGDDVNEMILGSVTKAVPTNVDSEHSNLLNTVSHSTDKLFPIFYPERWKPLERSNRRLQRAWCGGSDTNQYQLDLGQQNFGAQQCKQCGLVYSVHEPEEEKLHHEYHNSQHVLRFKGWIDEDIVAIYPEWGADGRILRISESSHIKRRERLADILKIVDKELGSSTYVIPNPFVAFLAVRKYQFVGLCLVQPLEKSSKYVCINGLDCYSEEQFPAKCGISRIWVSPLHRRLRIASKLVQAVQQNTIFGQEIPLHLIAFSAPTENGKLFAQRITHQENFLVYQ